MIKFVLHGGETSRKSLHNDLFFQQFTELVDKKSVKILMCYFAVQKSEWDELYKRDIKKVKTHTTKKVSFSLPNDLKDLLTKLDSYDVLYVAGGDAEFIEPFLPQLSTLKTKLKNKVYIGSSMGAFIVSKYYVLSRDSQYSNEVHKGLGILPINTLCHWDAENHKQAKIKILKAKAPNLPILTLDECKFTTLVI